MIRSIIKFYHFFRNCSLIDNCLDFDRIVQFSWQPLMPEEVTIIFPLVNK